MKVDKKEIEAAGTLEIHYDLVRLMNLVNHVFNNATREHGDHKINESSCCRDHKSNTLNHTLL